jgi:tripartite-type tricarboxylate transporter receptor subunit TctC
MELPRRQFLRFAAAAAVPFVPRTLWAEPYPTRPITVVVPIAAGGAVDTAARIIGEQLQAQLRQPVVVENRPGAGSLIGTNFVAKAPPMDTPYCSSSLVPFWRNGSTRPCLST